MSVELVFVETPALHKDPPSTDADTYLLGSLSIGAKGAIDAWLCWNGQ
jgi:hypothetical protein